MKLKTLILKNFRAYRDETRIDIGDLTAFIGKNDVGKSSIFEALEIFFNNDLVKIENLDACVSGQDEEVRIGCVFSAFPEEIVLDEEAKTTLKDEYLLNENGLLEVHKAFDCSTKSPKESVYAVAHHPSAENVSDLLSLKISDLKKRLDSLGVNRDLVNLRSKPSIRQAIRRSVADLSLARREIPLHKAEEDVKKIWDKLQQELPVFALFQADRKSKDGDPEVQNPMKLAVAEAIKSVQGQLDRIKDTVQQKATEVAKRTLEKLREMDASLAQQLSPEFEAEPKWEKLFTLTLTGDNQIPINKRGSGVRRLILLNFFRAEAERKQEDRNSPDVIYAIEEPETSQHPHNQKLIVQALKSLAEQGNCQVLISTHVPGLAGLLPLECVRYVSRPDGGSVVVREGSRQVYKQIADELGVVPENQVKAFVFVEGPNDVTALEHVSRVLHEVDNSMPDLSSDPRCILLHAGGSTLQHWVANHYLQELRRPEFHLYDRGTENPPKFSGEVATVNQWNDGSFARLTGKREMENYLHPDAISDALGVQIEFGDDDSVPELLARAFHEGSGSPRAWDELDPGTQKDKISNAKRRLNSEAFAKMTYERLRQIDPNADIENWLREVGRRLT